MENNSNRGTPKMCRTCLQLIDNNTKCFPIKVAQSTTVSESVASKLKYCIPELDFSLACNGFICNDCATTVTSAYKFKKKCLQIEELTRTCIREVLDGSASLNLAQILEQKRQEWYLSINGSDIKSSEGERHANIEFVAINSASIKQEPAQSNSDNESPNCRTALMENSANSEVLNNVNIAQDIMTNKECYWCSDCNYSTLHKLDLINHVRTHMDSRFASIKRKASRYNQTTKFNYLTIQQTKYLRKQTVQIAEKIHNNNGESCNFKLHDQSSNSSEQWICKSCGYNAVSHSSLMIHLRKHTGDKPFKCDLCSYSSTTKGGLSVHRKAHTGDKPFKCDLCSYRTSAKSSLGCHLKVHLNGRPFNCIECKAKFRSQDNLNLHMKVHMRHK